MKNQQKAPGIKPGIEMKYSPSQRWIFGADQDGRFVIVVCREPEFPYLWVVHSLISGSLLDRDMYQNDIIERAESGVYDNHTSQL